MDNTPVGSICAFCGTPDVSASSAASGLGVLMCGACLERFPEDAGSEQPWWAAISDEQVLETIPKITAVQDQVNDFLHRWVQLARERGHTWADIGRILGVSRQAAWQRFHTAGD